jgi:hypothetical protein
MAIQFEDRLLMADGWLTTAETQNFLTDPRIPALRTPPNKLRKIRPTSRKPKQARRLPSHLRFKSLRDFNFSSLAHCESVFDRLRRAIATNATPADCASELKVQTVQARDG